MSDYGKKTLELWNGTPVVRFDAIIDWHDITHEISQDLIVSAYLANNSLEKRVNQDFFADLGGSSLDYFSLLEQIKQEFNVEISQEEKLSCVEDFCKIIKR